MLFQPFQQSSFFTAKAIAASAMVLGLGAGMASAATYNFTNISNNNAVHAAAGESQLSMMVSAGGAGQVVFSFMNAMGGLASSLSNIYWEDTSSLLGSFVSFSGAGTNFTAGGAPPILPSGNTVGFVETFRASATSPPPMNGVNPGETLDVTINLAGMTTLAQVIAALDSGGMRVGVRVIGFPNDGSEAFVTTGHMIPLPGAACTGALGLALLASRRRRGV